MVFIAFAIELLIIACAWIASSMTPDPENGKYILIYAARHYLALPLGCLFMVTVVAIIISTADSFLHVPATSVVNDLYLPYVNRNASQAAACVGKSVFCGRVSASIAYVVTLLFSESTGFFQKALYAFTIYGACVTPSLVAALLWQRATKQGAIVSICSGALVTLVWNEVDAVRSSMPAVAELDAVLPAITVSVAMLVGVSLLTGPSSPTEGLTASCIEPPSKQS